MSETPPEPYRVDLSSLMRAPIGVDRELLEIFLKYNDVLIERGISTFNIWMKRAHYLYALGRFEEGVQAIQEALLHDPQSAEAHFQLGVCLQLMAVEEANGDLDGDIPLGVRSLLETAAVAFETVLEANPGDGEAQTALTNLRCLLYTPEANQMLAGQAGPPHMDGGLAGDDPDGMPVP